MYKHANLFEANIAASRHAVDGRSTQSRPTPSDLSCKNLPGRIEAACARVPPLWPLKNFVAVNPFMGLSDQGFPEACRTIRRVAHADLLMPATFYVDQWDRGQVTGQDLQSAIDSWLDSGPTGTAADAIPLTADRLLHELKSLAATTESGAVERILCVADALDSEGRWARLTTEEISKWCSAHYDEGQSSWQLPWRSSPAYVSWRQMARFDRSPEINGFTRFRDHVAQLPSEPVPTIGEVLKVLGIPDEAVEDFLHRALMSVAGWSAYVQYRVRSHAMQGHHDDSLVHLLAVRLAYDYALFREFGSELPVSFWRSDEDDHRIGPSHPPPRDAALTVRLLAQSAYERAFQRRLAADLMRPDRSRREAGSSRASVQAVFCIDVRSEVFRRSLEAASPEIRTHGYAGFFGVPMEYVPLGHHHGPAQCPVLIKPKFRVRESVAGAKNPQVRQILATRVGRKRAARVWKSFKLSAVSCFSYVETTGLLFASKLLTDAFGLTRPVTQPSRDGLDRDTIKHLGPNIDFVPAAEIGGVRRAAVGIPLADRIELAKGALRGMNLSGNISRLVLLCGHGSTTANNPYGASLDCGACGGHSGEANARTAAAILNDPSVRSALVDDGLAIPDDTWFLAGLHDTTTDEVRLCDLDLLPPSHQQDLSRLRVWLQQASQATRSQRAPRLGIRDGRPARVEGQVRSRSRDWSQVRPEWGLAGNAAFIAAPRERTRHINLGGRAFLHDYDPAADPDESILELIMTAPMVVASWINLQYFASTVDMRQFGSGNKAIHNVVGTIGVLQGNGGDLQMGLPFQSVHDGQRFVHEPLRLSVFIEASPPALERVLNRHEDVRRLVDNQWLHLFAITDEGSRILLYGGPGKWQAMRA